MLIIISLAGDTLSWIFAHGTLIVSVLVAWIVIKDLQYVKDKVGNIETQLKEK